MNFSPIQRLKILKTKKMCEGRYTSLLSFYSLLGSISQLDTTFQIVIINIINIIILVSKSLYKKYQVNNSNDISNNKPRPASNPSYVSLDGTPFRHRGFIFQMARVRAVASVSHSM